MTDECQITSSSEDQNKYLDGKFVYIILNNQEKCYSLDYFLKNYVSVNACTTCFTIFLLKIQDILQNTNTVLTLDNLRFLESSYRTFTLRWNGCQNQHQRLYCTACYDAFRACIDQILVQAGSPFYSTFSVDLGYFYVHFGECLNVCNDLHNDVPRINALN